jgi:hypothetical protein
LQHESSFVEPINGAVSALCLAKPLTIRKWCPKNGVINAERHILCAKCPSVSGRSLKQQITCLFLRNFTVFGGEFRILLRALGKVFVSPGGGL